MATWFLRDPSQPEFGDAPHQRLRPVLAADGTQIVATDRDRDERAGAVAGDVGDVDLVRHVGDRGTGTRNEDRLRAEFERPAGGPAVSSNSRRQSLLPIRDDGANDWALGPWSS